MAAPVVTGNVEIAPPDESAVWDVYRALVGAIVGSDRTEVWTMLTDFQVGSSDVDATEEWLFLAAAALVSALRSEASGLSPARDLREARRMLAGALGSSPARVW